MRFASERTMKVAMRGRGHSQYGQALADGGIVIDSRTLNAVRLGARSVEAQAGASWDDVISATLARGLTPPAMGDTMTLSVGGILSAGGISNSSHLYGGVVDHVKPGGRHRLGRDRPLLFRTESRVVRPGARRNGPMRAHRQRAARADRRSDIGRVRRDLIYDDLRAFLSDATRLANEASVDHLGTYLEPMDGGRRWRFTINVGRFTTPDRVQDFARIERDLRFVARADPVTTSYGDYLHREAARNAAAETARRTTPSRLLFVMMFIPSDNAEQVLGGILDSRRSCGLTDFGEPGTDPVVHSTDVGAPAGRHCVRRLSFQERSSRGPESIRDGNVDIAQPCKQYASPRQSLSAKRPVLLSVR